MKREQAPAIEITGDGSATLFNERFQEAFHSGHGAAAESRHVFLGASGVQERLLAGQTSIVLEIGFGLGLNFVLTAAQALQSGAALRYVALELELQSAAVLARLNYAAFAPELWAALLDWRNQLCDTPEYPVTFSFPADGGLIELQVVPGDATSLLRPASEPAGTKLQLPPGVQPGPFNAVYQDAFSPAANPELWSPTFLAGLLSLLEPGGKLVTYSVNGQVRRSLLQLGAEVSKQPGPAGGKREMLLAVRR